MLVVHYEPENAPADAAAKTMKCLTRRTDMKRRRLFLVKRAKRPKIRSGTFQREIRANHLDDVIRRRDLLDCLCWNGRHWNSIFRSFASRSDAKFTQQALPLPVMRKSILILAAVLLGLMPRESEARETITKGD